jgi:hypothetical protein
MSIADKCQNVDRFLHSKRSPNLGEVHQLTAIELGVGTGDR